MTEVVNRKGHKVPFDKNRIVVAISKAMKCGLGDGYKPKIAEAIADEIESRYKDKVVDIHDIEKDVYTGLITHKQKMTAKAYEGFRSIKEYQHTVENSIDEDIIRLLDDDNEYWKGENANKNPRLNPTKRDYMAGIVSTDATRRYLLPPDIVQAHDNGIIHFHDADYFGQHMHNCDLVNLEDMLQNGTVISETYISKPHRFTTAATITTQIIAQVASNQYGGQSISLAHLAPFVQASREEITRDVLNEVEILNADSSRINEIINKRLHDEIKRGIQTIQYQLTTLMTTNGQAPFITVFMYLNEAKNEQEKKDLAMLIEEVLRQRIQGVQSEDGTWIAPAFPKLIYVLEDDNVYEGQSYFYLTKLAAECTSKRLVPDYISEKKMFEYKGDVYTCMGCRSFLTPDRFTDKVGNIASAKNYNGQHKYYGRFNQGVVTINLVDVALSADGDYDKFWELFDERLELCHRALRLRHERLLGTTTDVSPILWQYGALARLKKGEKIDKLLYGGYSTISLGFAGLYECVKVMTGYSQSNETIGKPFGLKVMQHMNDMCDKWKHAENIDYSLYGTPLESTTYKFSKCLKKRFGDDVFIRIDGHDRNYITNSYHIPVFEQIDAFSKLYIESQFQRLAPGGAISYIETPDMKKNVPALIKVIQYMYENIMYAEINTKSCHCEKCGYDGDIPIVSDEGGKLTWECPNCGNTDGTTMDIAFRVCGYIGTSKNGSNQGRMGDVADRVYHIDDKEEI